MHTPHGGNIYRLAESLGIGPEEIIDFSASINPLGVPESAREAMTACITHLVNYPDPDMKDLKSVISEGTGVEPASIVCGNGSTELIYLMARALGPKKVLIPDPTFSEYERACAAIHGTKVIHYGMEKERMFDVDPADFARVMAGEVKASSACDTAFLCNPNNPTGRLMRRDEILEIADAAKSARCTLVVDEAFIDFCPGASVIHEVRNNPYLVVLRSLTKFYALSGLRLGYAVLPPRLYDPAARAKEPWTVNTLAQEAGIAALADEAYRNETYRIVAEEKAFLEEGFRRLGIFFAPSAANFYLLKFEKGPEITARLKGKGILVRDCSSFIGLDDSYIRVAVKSRRDNTRLLEEISLCMA